MLHFLTYEPKQLVCYVTVAIQDSRFLRSFVNKVGYTPNTTHSLEMVTSSEIDQCPNT